MGEMKTEAVITNSHGPLFSFFNGKDTLENDRLDSQSGDIIDLDIVARNIFKYLALGIKLDTSDPKIIKGLALVAKALVIKANPEFNRAFLRQLQNMLKSLGFQLNDVDEETEAKYEILISNLLAAYPFFADHKCTNTLSIPQKIKEKWELIEHQVQALDLSPQTGMISRLIRDEDRIYAYGLTPVVPRSDSPRLLLLMGTTYPTGQGSALSTMRVFDVGYSVGEGYHWGTVENWLFADKQPKVKVIGLSQGGASAMFVAAKYSSYIIQADCHNPPALCSATLNRLHANWLKTPKDSRPIINVYAQKGDPVFPLEHGFLEGSRIFRIDAVKDSRSNLKPIPSFVLKSWEAHLHFFVGRKDSKIEVEIAKEYFTPWRVFFGDLKATVNLIVCPFLVADLFLKLVLHHAMTFFLKSLPRVLTIPAAVIGFIPYYALKLCLRLMLVVVPAILLVPALLLTSFASGLKIGFSSVLGLSLKPQLEEGTSSLVLHNKI